MHSDVTRAKSDHVHSTTGSKYKVTKDGPDLVKTATLVPIMHIEGDHIHPMDILTSPSSKYSTKSQESDCISLKLLYLCTNTVHIEGDINSPDNNLAKFQSQIQGTGNLIPLNLIYLCTNRGTLKGIRTS